MRINLRQIKTFIAIVFSSLLLVGFQNCGGDVPDSYTRSSGCPEGQSCGSGGENGPALEVVNGALKFDDGSVLRTCKEYVDSENYDGEGDGYYWLDWDGAGGEAEAKHYCNMSLDGGGWTLITNRRGGQNNTEFCGNNINQFIHAPCGNVDSIAYGDSYNLGGSTERAKFSVMGEYLFAQNNSAGVVDQDDAYVIVLNNPAQDLFPNNATSNPQTVNVMAVCNVNAVCDMTNVQFRYQGVGRLSSGVCNSVAGGTGNGAYGYCHNGPVNVNLNSLFGTIGGHTESKIWGITGSAAAAQERIYIR